LQKSLAKFREDHPNEKYLGLVLRDEVSNLAKESHGGRSSNIWEFLSEAYDGYIPEYDTIRGGTEEYPDVLMPMWMSGTPIFYDYVGDSFWDQGFATRCLFVKMEKNHFDGMSDADRDAFLRLIESSLEKIPAIKGVRATEEWTEKLNDYMKEIVERSNVEIDNIETPEKVPIDFRAEEKYPQIIIKLSMVHCAARGGWEKKEDGTYLVMDSLDFDRAKEDLNMYKEGFVESQRIFQSRRVRQMRIEKNTVQVERIMAVIRSALPSEKYEIKFTDSLNNNIVIAEVDRNEKGKYISKSLLLKKTGYVAKTIDSLLKTMEDGEYIEIIRTGSSKNDKVIEMHDKTVNTKQRTYIRTLRDSIETEGTYVGVDHTIANGADKQLQG
jgi:hypothetical protein